MGIFAPASCKKGPAGTLIALARRPGVFPAYSSVIRFPSVSKPFDASRSRLPLSRYFSEGLERQIQVSYGLSKAAEMLAKMCGWNEPEQVNVQSVEVKVDAALIEQLRPAGLYRGGEERHTACQIADQNRHLP